MKPEAIRQGRPPGRGAVFAQAVAQRHGVGRAAGPLERVLRMHTAMGIVDRVRRMFVLNVSMRLGASVAAGANAGRAVRPLVERVFADGRERGAATAFETRTARRDLLATRLLARETRRSILARESVLRTSELVVQASRGARAPGPAGPALPRVLARPAPAAPAAARPTRDAVDQATAPSWRMDAAQRPATAAVDVQRLTREVMRGIDERILAHRERLGRS